MKADVSELGVGAGNVEQPHDEVQLAPSQESHNATAKSSPSRNQWATPAAGVIDQAVVSGTNFVSTLLVGRICGASELGIYALAFSLLVIINSFHNSLTSAPYTLRWPHLPQDTIRRFSGNVVVHLCMLLLVCVGLSLLILASRLTQFLSPQLILTGWALVAAIPPFVIRNFARKFELSHMRVNTVLKVDLVVAVLQLFLLVMLALYGMLSATTALMTIAVANVAAILVWLAVASTYFRPHWSALAIDWRENWLLSRWVAASDTVSVSGNYVIYWLLAAMLGTVSTGVYSACMTVILLANPVLLGLQNVLQPRVARLLAIQGETAMRRTVHRAIAVYAAFMVPFFLVAALAGGTIVTLLFDGEEYAAQGGVVAVLALMTLVESMAIPASCGLWAMGRTNLTFLAGLVDLLLSIPLAIVLTPAWGLMGAAVALLIASATATVLRFVAFHTSRSRIQASPRQAV